MSLEGMGHGWNDSGGHWRRLEDEGMSMEEGGCQCNLEDGCGSGRISVEVGGCQWKWEDVSGSGRKSMEVDVSGSGRKSMEVGGSQWKWEDVS